MRRRTMLAGAATTGTAAVVAALVLGGGAANGQGGDGDDDRADAAAAATAEVTRRDLTETAELDGTLGYGDASDVTLGGDGTITDLADEGAVVVPGAVLAEVDGEPVVLLAGERAAWRDLHPGVSNGVDVQQLEQTLVDLGFASAEDLGPDDDWTAATTEAVEALQAAVGAEEDGTLELGTAVFAPGAVRVASHLVEPGAGAGAPALSITGTDRIVTIDLAADDQSLLEVGMDVVVELPDGTTVDGVIFAIADIVDPPAQEGGEPTVEVVVTFAEGADTGTVDQAPVDVTVIEVAVEDALTVPVEALLALAEGGYAVELPDGSLVGVELGGFADGFVQVTPTSGTLEEGDEVVVPS